MNAIVSDLTEHEINLHLSSQQEDEDYPIPIDNGTDYLKPSRNSRRQNSKNKRHSKDYDNDWY